MVAKTEDQREFEGQITKHVRSALKRIVEAARRKRGVRLDTIECMALAALLTDD